MSAFNSAINAMMNTMRQVRGQRARYVRGSSSVPVVVVPARTNADLAGDDGFVTRMTADDYLLDVADLVIDGQPTRPQLNDRIVITDTGSTFEVMDLPGDGCWVYSGQNRATYRIHTRQV